MKRKNLNTFDHMISNISKDDFECFYRSHSTKEINDHFLISTTTL